MDQGNGQNRLSLLQRDRRSGAFGKKGDHHMFPITSANLTQEHRKFGRATASTITSGAAAIALLASTTTFAHAAENSSRMVQEQHACAVVMGLRQPGDLYDTCVRSLAKTLAELDQARLVATDQRACGQEGLKPGTPALAVCLVNAEQTIPDRRRRLSALITPSNEPTTP
jgi:hypothetical protein